MVCQFYIKLCFDLISCARQTTIKTASQCYGFLDALASPEETFATDGLAQKLTQN